jgi:hypothetical protein
MLNDDTKEAPAHSDGPVQHCVGGADWSHSSPTPSSKYPLSARAVFELPVSSDTLYLLARGSLAHGSATILADSQEGGDKVKVDVLVNYSTQEALDRAKVCSLQRKSHEHGVGIFVSFFVFVKISVNDML